MQFYKECYLYSEIIHFWKLGDPVYLPSHTSILARESKVAENNEDKESRGASGRHQHKRWCNLAKYKEEEDKIVMSIPFVMLCKQSHRHSASTCLQAY